MEQVSAIKKALGHDSKSKKVIKEPIYESKPFVCAKYHLALVIIGSFIATLL